MVFEMPSTNIRNFFVASYTIARKRGSHVVFQIIYGTDSKLFGR